MRSWPKTPTMSTCPPPPPIKVLHLLPGLGTGGAEMMLFKLMARSDRTRIASVVVSLTDGGTIGPRIAALGVPVIPLGMNPKAPDLPGEMWRLLRIVRREQPHVLQTWLYYADVMGTLAGKLAGVPALAWNIRCSNMDSKRYSRKLTIAIRLLAVLSPIPDVVLVNAHAGRQLHEQHHYRPRRWELLPNGFDTAHFQPDASARQRLCRLAALPPQRIIIGMVARYDPMKDHATLLQAAHLLLQEQRNAHLVLVGLGMVPDNAALMQQIAQYGIAAHISLLGERHDVAGLMPGFDIATLSSAFGEGFPNVIGEAMACGVPCVVTDVGDSAHVVGESGIVVPPRDAPALARGWRVLIALGPHGRQHLGQAARRRIETHFSLARIVQRYDALYQELASAKGIH